MHFCISGMQNTNDNKNWGCTIWQRSSPAATIRGCEQLTMQPEALMFCMNDIIQNGGCTILQLSETISDSVHVLI
jgi:hypothetical protein